MKSLGFNVPRAVVDYHCRFCEPLHGSSTYRPQRRKSSRPHSFVDYVSLDQGDVAMSDQHAYTVMIENKRFSKDTFRRIRGSELTKEWAENEGFNEPVLIPTGWDYDGLEMQIPKDLTVQKVLEILGPHEKIEVIDVPLQKEISGWSLGEWVEYYEKPPEKRERIRNVISLEISFSKLSEYIVRPKFVRDLDFADRMWPKDLKEKGIFPKVQLYCLMSVKNSFTDFHIDFGGTSVFYHIIKGSKTFLFVAPTQINLKKYENWCLSSDQRWIHAVHTPSDSLVLGGNFLTHLHIEMQLLIADIERRTKVPQKFKYPFFEKLLWFSTLHYLSIPLEHSENFDHYLHHKKVSNIDEQSKNRKIHEKELAGLAPITANGEKLNMPTQRQLRAIKLELPFQFFSGDFVELAKAFGRWTYYRKKLNYSEFPKWCLPGPLTSFELISNDISKQKKNKIASKKRNAVCQFNTTLNIQANNKKKKDSNCEEILKQNPSGILNHDLSLHSSKPTYIVKFEDNEKAIEIEDTPRSKLISPEFKVDEQKNISESNLASYNIFSDNTVDNATKQAIKAAMFGLRRNEESETLSGITSINNFN
ncbi:hypothetical protein MERGE_002382 [Pneumocystis wakefieldiae]|uniref:[histone H3]-dimethyl-L-lysine(36) demethylase n=1 Tax=Pneumocystis wakefieldiae TaxID=38082 RepID=A0A899G926_9ASCO|nr:hypothetical protein MERGE_002382 [Pneumocystis wakefieldiae]